MEDIIQWLDSIFKVNQHSTHFASFSHIFILCSMSFLPLIYPLPLHSTNYRVSRGCWIHRLLLCRGVSPSSECPRYDTKQSDGDVPVMSELWGMKSTPPLPSFPGSLWSGVVAPDSVLSMGQIELNCELELNWIAWNRTVLIFKLCTYAKLNCLKSNSFWYWNRTYAKLRCLK